MKITEIKVTAGKDVFILKPNGTEVITAGRLSELGDEKMSAALFKAVAGPADKLVEELLRKVKA